MEVSGWSPRINIIQKNVSLRSNIFGFSHSTHVSQSTLFLTILNLFWILVTEGRIRRVQPIKRKMSEYAIEIYYQKKFPISVRQSLILFRLELKNINQSNKKSTKQNMYTIPSKTNKTPINP